MRTTVRLDEALLLRAKRHAADTRRTLTQLIADGLLGLIEREQGTQSPRRVKLPVFKGDGVHEGVDVNSSVSALEQMERGIAT
ncbi:MAG: hypothetical protein WDA75_06915 [Candidatus Latescibacterota bacterium]|jgi:hypothetical protein